jgi:GTP-binding protein
VKVIGSIGSQEDDFPRGSKGISEVAIAGRSNVGKSTLLNALLYGNASPENKEDSLPFRKRNRATSRTARLAKGLKAVTSSKPGQTRTLEFYQLSSIVNMDKVSLMLVDLPGYGFAYATEEKMEGWRSLMQDYILRRGKPLKRVLLLIDSRHGMKKADIEFMSELQGALYENNKEIVGERSTKVRF